MFSRQCSAHDRQLPRLLLAARCDEFRLVDEGAIMTVQHIADLEPARRTAILVAQISSLGTRLADATLAMFEKYMGSLFTKAQNRDERRFQATKRDVAKAIAAGNHPAGRVVRHAKVAVVATQNTGLPVMLLGQRRVYSATIRMSGPGATDCAELGEQCRRSRSRSDPRSIERRRADGDPPRHRGT